ncbi:uncharacterized protein LOC124707650 isoform X2 [Lolium rigidum]|uniref:uncharacterized protein LOC124707650 isoform X2 n=1 Tax=Lolium rigidum TaxID=89674 RepID=UPI001F5DB628|nr:uncharacterized protein LOC124707650 isoform X2 [Lolium rigidum]
MLLTLLPPKLLILLKLSVQMLLTGNDRNAWMCQTRRGAKSWWITWRCLTCGSTLLRAVPTASPCLSASSATSYLSAIQLYTTTSLTISRRRMGSEMDYNGRACSRARILVVAAGHARWDPGCGCRPCSRGLLVVAVRAKGRPDRVSRRRRTPAGTAEGSTEEGLTKTLQPATFSPRAPAASLDLLIPRDAIHLSLPLLPPQNAWMGRTRRGAKSRWTTWCFLTCWSTLLRAVPTSSMCLSASSTTSYLSAIQLYTATSLTISRRRMGGEMDY